MQIKIWHLSSSIQNSPVIDESKSSLLLIDIVSTIFIPGMLLSEKGVEGVHWKFRAFYGIGLYSEKRIFWDRTKGRGLSSWFFWCTSTAPSQRGWWSSLQLLLPFGLPMGVGGLLCGVIPRRVIPRGVNRPPGRHGRSVTHRGGSGTGTFHTWPWTMKSNNIIGNCVPLFAT